MITEERIEKVWGLLLQLSHDTKKWVIRLKNWATGTLSSTDSSANGHWGKHRTSETFVLFYQVKQVAHWDFILFHFIFRTPLREDPYIYIYIIFLKLNVFYIRKEKFAWHSKTYWLGINWSEILCFPESLGNLVLMGNFVVLYLL